MPRETFLLRSGQPALDRSLLAVGQLQHGRTIGGWQRLLYGVDVLRTVPVTEGTLNGIHEERDAFTEVGAFAQSKARLGPRWDLILALRGDHHSVLDGVIVSPRLALVHRPAPGHQLRATLNRRVDEETARAVAIGTDERPGVVRSRLCESLVRCAAEGHGGSAISGVGKSSGNRQE